MSRMKTVLIVAAATCLLAGAAIVGLMRGSERAPALVQGSSYPRWPAENLTDWAGFADQVSLVRVTSEEQLPLGEDVKTIGEGYVGRRVTMQIESTLWRRAGAPWATGSVPVAVDGWWSHEHQLTPYADLGTKRVEVGDRLLVALLQTPEGAWSLLSPATAFPVTASGITPKEVQLTSYPQLAQALRGKTVGQIARLLASTSPSEAAATHQKLDPDARARVVWADQLKAANPGQGSTEP